MKNEIVLKFLNNKFEQLPDGIDIKNDLTSFNIKDSISDGSSITLKTPLTKRSKKWLKIIQDSIKSDNPEDVILIRDINNIQNIWLIDSVNFNEHKIGGKSEIVISGYSAEWFLKSRLSTKKVYTNENIGNIIKDIISGAGLGGINNSTYPFDIGGGEGDRVKRYIDLITCSVNLEINNQITYETSNEDCFSYVSEIIKAYGKRMYSVYDEINKKIKIIIDDGIEKTRENSGLKFIISTTDNSVSQIMYNLDRNERINVFLVNNGTNIDVYTNDSNPVSSINRREQFMSNQSIDDSSAVEQNVKINFEKADAALEQMVVNATFGDKFNYGVGTEQIFIGDKVSIIFEDENNQSIVINEVITEMNITSEISNSFNKVNFIPTIGNEEKDDQGKIMTFREKINYISNKKSQQLKNS